MKDVLNVVDPEAKQLSSVNLLDKPYVIHCVGVEKEADLVPVFAVSFLSFLFDKS